MRGSILCCALALSFFTAPDELFALPVFPDAKGHGSHTVAGSGRHLATPNTTVFKVTSLANSGAGTLRECAEATMPRVCIFETSGRIQLSSDIKIREPYITIAGQTAPPPGILVTGAPIRVENHDVLIQHLEMRAGDGAGSNPEQRDSMGVGINSSGRAAYNVVIDHVSISWGIDENISTYHGSTHDVTFSNLIVAEGLHNSIHPEGGHSSGMMVGDFGTDITIHSTLFAHNHDRNGYWKPGTKGEFLGNVIYNWGGTSGSNITNLSDHNDVGAPVLLNFIGNYYKKGVNSSHKAPLNGSPVDSGTRVYALGNIGPTRPTDSGDEWLISNMPSSPHRVMSAPVPLTGAPLRSPEESWNYVLANAGSRPAERNDVDARIIHEVITGTGTTKDCVSGCSRSAGGWPVRAVNVRALSLPSNPNADSDGDGYTNLEEFLHSYAAIVEGAGGQAPPPPTPTIGGGGGGTPSVTPTPGPTSTSTPRPTATPTKKQKKLRRELERTQRRWRASMRQSRVKLAELRKLVAKVEKLGDSPAAAKSEDRVARIESRLDLIAGRAEDLRTQAQSIREQLRELRR